MINLSKKEERGKGYLLSPENFINTCVYFLQL